MTETGTEQRRRTATRNQEASEPDAADAVSETRREAEDLLQRAERIINRALTGSSVDWLRLNQQQGGQ